MQTHGLFSLSMGAQDIALYLFLKTTSCGFYEDEILISTKCRHIENAVTKSENVSFHLSDIVFVFLLFRHMNNANSHKGGKI